MATTRKSRTANKRLGKASEESPEKDAGGGGSRGNARKRKLSDMLGHPWSGEELECFYEAYREHGKDWKKVAGAIQNRSTEMVEALYKVNKAYLSLSDGMATAAGLIAMMTDHYDILKERSDTDAESNGGVKPSKKSRRHGRGKLRSNSTKGTNDRHPDLLAARSSPTTYRLPFSKKTENNLTDFVGSQPRAVGKRTPRFPVSYISDKGDKNKVVSPKKQGFNIGKDAGSDDEGAHVAALALAEACQRGGSPQISRTLGSKADVHSLDRNYAGSDVTNSKLNVQTDEEGVEGSLGSREAENEDIVKDNSIPLDCESAGKHAAKPKKRRFKVKKSKGITGDAREACSGTEEGIASRGLKDETDVELSDQKGATSGHPSNKSRQLLFGDEITALDALQTLADLSTNMLFPSAPVESASSAQVKEKRSLETEKAIAAERMLKNGKREKTKWLSTEKIEQGPVIDTMKRKNPKHQKSSVLDINVSLEGKSETNMPLKIQTRKRKTLLAKVSKAELQSEPPQDKPSKVEILADEVKISAPKTKRSSQFIAPLKQIKHAKPPEYSHSSTDQGKSAAEIVEVTAQVSNEICLQKQKKNRRKMTLHNALALKEPRTSEGAGENHLDKYAACEMADVKEKLSHCLMSPLLRRWCMFEWFYSAIDYPWFARSEYVEYLTHVGLGHIPRLTRVEWGVIRSSLGKPRRFSQQLIQEEREKLEQYRDSVRKHYTDLRAGICEGLPMDLARPLTVGQRVIACHPKTREIHDGSVLTVDRNRCRVQFDRPELGVEFVMDIDCMPLDPLENMPDALRKQIYTAEKLLEGFNETKPYDYLKECKLADSNASNENLETMNVSGHCSASDYSMNTLMKHAKEDTIDGIVQAKAAANEVVVATRHAMFTQPCTLAQIQAKEDDIKALAELTRALDKKEALLIELRHMNEEVSLKQKDGESIKDIENFRKQYAMVLLQLRDANDLVAASLVFLRTRNTYVGHAMFSQTNNMENPMEQSVACGSHRESALPLRDSDSHILRIVDVSRRKAKSMVDAAIQAMSSLKEGENPFIKVGEALNTPRISHSRPDYNAPAMKSFQNVEQVHNNSFQEPATSCLLEQTAGNEPLDIPSNKTSVGDESQFPSELISSCISTLLMIQRCTERQYPPAEVAQILETAVTSLLPCCSQNLPIYREIEACMGIIKNQMLALIPSPTSILPTENTVM